jgi:hypothetical protein
MEIKGRKKGRCIKGEKNEKNTEDAVKKKWRR